jgi:hypothetical protein
MTVQDTVELARKISKEPNPVKRVPDTEIFLKSLNDMKPEELTEVIALLASYDDNPGAVSKSLREGAIIAAEAKNTKSLTDAMATLTTKIDALTTKSETNAESIVKATENFDKKAFWLTVMLIVLSVVGVLVALIADDMKKPILRWLHIVH